MRRWWHQAWIWHFDRVERRARWRQVRSIEHANHHRRQLLIGLPEKVPYAQDFSWQVQISGPGPEPGPEPEPETLDTTHLRHLFPVPDQDMDGPDSPEADHAFWEQTAEDVLGGGLAVPEAWQVGLPDDPPDDPLSS